MQTFKAVIIDDERYASERLKKLLIPYPRIEIASCFTDSRSGLKYILEERPDLVFLDIEMEKGASAFDLIDNLDPCVKKPYIIIVTGHPHYSIKAIKHEVFDYLIKPVDIDELQETITRLLRHFMPVQETLIRKYDMLSDRELNVLNHVLEGRSSEEIATLLFISKNTVNTHRRNILKKTGAKSFFDLLKST